jgi:hypothetical protein
MSEAKYRALSYEEVEALNYDECYSILVGPNDFCCVLTEPEDRIWTRDGKEVVDELNQLLNLVTELKTLNESLCNRIAAQSELLSKKAEKQ